MERFITRTRKGEKRNIQLRSSTKERTRPVIAIGFCVCLDNEKCFFFDRQHFFLHYFESFHELSAEVRLEISKGQWTLKNGCLLVVLLNLFVELQILIKKIVCPKTYYLCSKLLLFKTFKWLKCLKILC